MTISASSPIIADDSGSKYSAVLQADGGDTLHLPDAATMFRGGYAQVGPDLVITGPGGDKTLIVDYFGQGTAPTLMSPGGAILAGDLVTQLAGGRFAGQYAQAAPGPQAAPVGLVETITGPATITHADGTRTQAAVGTPVFEGDVVETSGAARISITFTDKTVASLGESARLVIDKFVYDAGGSQNSMLLSLVQGAFVFVAGLVAPTGDMKVQTPVATMGIRGTTGIVRADVQDGTSYFTLKPDPADKLGGVAGTVGAFDVFSRLSGALIKEVRVPDQLLIVRNAAGQFEDQPQLGSSESAFQQQILGFAFASHVQMLTRTEGNQPQQQQQPPGQRGDNAPSDATKQAGLSVPVDATQAFRLPLAVELIKQVDPLTGETHAIAPSLGGAVTSGASPVLTGAGEGFSFKSAAFDLTFDQASATPGIQGTFPISLATTNGAPAQITNVIKIVSAASIDANGDVELFALTPAQTQALANAYDPLTGRFDLAIDTTFLGQGQKIVLTTVITISDGLGHTASQAQTFTIRGLNDEVVIQATAPDAAAATLAGAGSTTGNTVILHPEAGPPGAIWQPVDIGQSGHWAGKAFFGSGQPIASGTADGIAFVVQTTGAQAVGFGGEGIGFASIPNAFGVKFDTYQNAGEPAYDFARFFVTDAAGHSTLFTPLEGGLPDLGNLTDNQLHDISIDWDPLTRQLSYAVDHVHMGSFTLPEGFTLPPSVQTYAGFTSAGGAATSPTRIDITEQAFTNATSGVIVDTTPTAGVTHSVQGTFKFSDPDIADQHTITATLAGGTSSELSYAAGVFTTTITVDAQGNGVTSWTYTVDGAALDGYAGGQETYRVTISDGRSSTSTDITVTLKGGGFGDGPMAHYVVNLDDNVISQAVHGSDSHDVIQLDLHGNTKLTSFVDGAGGDNALHLLGQAPTIDLTGLTSHQLTNINEISIMRPGQTLALSLESIIDMTSAPTSSFLAGLQSVAPNVSTSHILVVDHANLSSGSNALDLSHAAGGAWVDTGQSVSSVDSAAAANASNTGYHIYNFVSSDPSHAVLATLAVQSGIDVHLTAHA